MKLTSKMVETILYSLLYTEDEVIDERIVIVDGIILQYGFHPDRVTNAKVQIAELLKEVPQDFLVDGGGGSSFLRLCFDRHGSQWTGSHRMMESLCVLAIAADLGRWLMPREMWPILPGGVPYVVFAPNGFPSSAPDCTPDIKPSLNQYPDN